LEGNYRIFDAIASFIAATWLAAVRRAESARRANLAVRVASLLSHHGLSILAISVHL
jgi:hypothetical protein